VALILDTNALSAAADGEPAALQVLAQAQQIVVPVIVLGEFRFGVAQSRYRRAYEDWLAGWIADVDIAELDEKTASFYATVAIELKARGKPIPTNDLWIAALCRQHSLPLLTRDRHFDHVTGLQRLTW
jgi:tRNA(fMet)-specific endonuclease VapC